MASECQPLGSVKDRYLAVAKGDTTQIVDSDDEVDNTLVDKNGEKIERSGGKEQVVKSSDGVGNIRARFGSIGQSSWKKQGEEVTSSVDSKSVNSARNLFKNLDQKKDDDQKSFNRPTTRKVRDPKELMEMRKKATYGNDEEIPEDGVVRKSVTIEKDELSTVNRKEALRKYEELEKNAKSTEFQPVNKPTNRLMSDEDAKYELSRRSGSVSGSDTGYEVMIDTSGDVSGYEGSVSPCSPTSEMSDDYISDTPKEEEKVPENTNDDGFESFQKGVVADGE